MDNVLDTFCECGNDLPKPQGILKDLQQNILDCSWIKQPQFAFSASLVTLSTLISRKVVFQGMAPNLYVMNIAPSGSGKDAPQKKVQEWLVDAKARSLLGSGDYVSDASLMDGLETQPVRLDIMDECGGVLKTVNSGNSDYNGKMADVLAELYTCSNSIYLGRATAMGVKGFCRRPNVNILGSTTPTGFTEGVSLRAIEKGLLGRFLIFFGDQNRSAERLKSLPKLDTNTLNKLMFWHGYSAEESDEELAGIPQAATELSANEEANKRLDEVFHEFDTLRCNTEHNDPTLPIVARLYQQMVKIVIIHACSRSGMEVPIINKDDVEFGYKTIQYYFKTIKGIVEKYIFSSKGEKYKVQILNIVKDLQCVTKRELYEATKELTKRERDSIIDELVELEYITQSSYQDKNTGQYKIVYTPKEELDENNREERRDEYNGAFEPLTEVDVK